MSIRRSKQREVNTVTCDKCGGLKVHPDLPNTKCSRCAGTGRIPYRDHQVGKPPASIRPAGHEHPGCVNCGRGQSDR